MIDNEKVYDGVHDHDLEPAGLGEPDEPYFTPNIDNADEEKELPFCSSDEHVPEADGPSEYYNA